MKSNKKSSLGLAFSLVALILSLVALGVTAVAVVYRYLSERAFYKKWTSIQLDDIE